jgi:hypothetical protein
MLFNCIVLSYKCLRVIYLPNVFDKKFKNIHSSSNEVDLQFSTYELFEIILKMLRNLYLKKKNFRKRTRIQYIEKLSENGKN